MFGKGGLGNIMQQAQKMQQRMQENTEKVKEELNKMRVVGESGAGLVKVTLNGNSQVCGLQIDDSLFTDSGGRELLEDLIVAAINDGLRRATQLYDEKMNAIADDMGLPLGFKMPL